MIVADASSIARNEEELTVLSGQEQALHLEFPRGIIGFETQKQYVLHSLEEGPLMVLSAFPNEQQFFYLINPYVVRSDYVLDIQEEDYDFLHNPKPKNIMVFAVVTMQNSIESITCNLVGPIIINVKEHVACQCVNLGDAWTTQHLLANGKAVTSYS